MIILGRRFSPAVLALAGSLLGLCALCLASLLLHVGGVGGAASAPGRFLFESFSWAGFFVPLYFLAGVVLLFAPVFRRRSAIVLILSIVPFLTLSLILAVLHRSPSALAQLLSDSFGMIPAALLLFLLLALELIFLAVLPFGFSAPRGSRSRSAWARRYRGREWALPLFWLP